jgi:hypothetical protein
MISSDEAQAAIPQLWNNIAVLEQALSMDEIDVYIVRQHAQKLSSKHRFVFLRKVSESLVALHSEAQNVQQLLTERASIQEMLRDYETPPAEVDVESEKQVEVLCRMLANNIVQLVDAVQRWRDFMTQPLPVLKEDGTNALIHILMELGDTGELAELQSSRTPRILNTAHTNFTPSPASKSKTPRGSNRPLHHCAHSTFTLENSGHFPYSYEPEKTALNDVSCPTTREIQDALLFLKQDYASQIELWRRKKLLLEHHQVESLLRSVYDATGAVTIPEHLVLMYERNVSDCLRITAHALSRRDLELLGLAKPPARLDWKRFFGGCKFPPFFGPIVKSCGEAEQLNAACAAILLRKYLEAWKRFNLWKQSQLLAGELAVLAENAQRRLRFRTWLRYAMICRNQAISDMVHVLQSKGVAQSFSSTVMTEPAASSAKGQSGTRNASSVSASRSAPHVLMSLVRHQPSADVVAPMQDRGEIATQTDKSKKRVFPIIR